MDYSEKISSEALSVRFSLLEEEFSGRSEREKEMNMFSKLGCFLSFFGKIHTV